MPGMDRLISFLLQLPLLEGENTLNNGWVAEKYKGVIPSVVSGDNINQFQNSNDSPHQKSKIKCFPLSKAGGTMGYQLEDPSLSLILSSLFPSWQELGMQRDYAQSLLPSRNPCIILQ